MPPATAPGRNAGVIESAGDRSHSDSFGGPCAHLLQGNSFLRMFDKFAVEGTLIVGRGTRGKPVLGRLVHSPGPQTLGDNTAFELCSCAHHLAHEGTHRVVIVIGKLLAPPR